MTFILDNLLLVGLALVSGGLLLWPLVAKRGGGAATLSPLEATQLINHDNAVIVDLRAEKDFALGSLAGARNLPQPTLAERASELVRFKARPLLLICDNGQQSTRAMATFKDLGFGDVHALAGGIAAWKAASLPLVVSARSGGADTRRPGAKDAGRKGKSDNRGRQQKPLALTSSAPEATPVTTPLAEAVVAAPDATTTVPDDVRSKEVS